MTWDEYVNAKAALKIDDEEPPALIMAGVAGDNGTRYLENQRGEEFKNDETLLQNSRIENRDFVWTGQRVRAHAGFSSGGHPALAGFSTIYCAGVVKRGFFFFHSGHYHPEVQHALHFFSDFVNNTCDGMAGVARDGKVDQLSKINLKLYVDGSETETYYTSFAQLAAEGARPKAPTPARGMGKAPMTMGQSMPMPKSMPTSTGASSPSLVQQVSSVPVEKSADSPAQLLEETGINPFGRHQLQVRIDGAPPWIDNSSRIKCACCDKTFGKLRWKHHCRRCGEIVCDDCSKHRKNVKNPVKRPEEEKPEAQPVRVCNLCYSKEDLL